MEWNGTECLDSRLLCLAVEHHRLPQSAPWSGAEVIPEKAITLRPLMAIPSTSLPLGMIVMLRGWGWKGLIAWTLEVGQVYIAKLSSS